MSYESRYVIVAGVAWIRRSRVVTTDGAVEDTVWAVTFDDGAPKVQRAPAQGDIGLHAGRIGDLEWELEWSEMSPEFETPRPWLRRVAPTRMRTSPAIVVSGRIGGRVLDGAAGHTAELRGRRHARSWGWAHASAADGRWAHVLTASVPPLRLSQYGRDGRPPGLPLARAAVGETSVTVGPYTVEAPAESFIGLRYLDTDGSTIWCYHSERGHLHGDGVEFENAAVEIAARAPIEGWAVEP